MAIEVDTVTAPAGRTPASIAADPTDPRSDRYVLDGEDWAQRYDDDDNHGPEDELTADERAAFVERLAESIPHTLDEISALTWENGESIRREIIANRTT